MYSYSRIGAMVETLLADIHMEIPYLYMELFSCDEKRKTAFCMLLCENKCVWLCERVCGNINEYLLFK